MMILISGLVFDLSLLSKVSNGQRSCERTWTISVLLVMCLCMMKWHCSFVQDSHAQYSIFYDDGA